MKAMTEEDEPDMDSDGEDNFRMSEPVERNLDDSMLIENPNNISLPHPATTGVTSSQNSKTNQEP